MWTPPPCTRSVWGAWCKAHPSYCIQTYPPLFASDGSLGRMTPEETQLSQWCFALSHWPSVSIRCLFPRTQWWCSWSRWAEPCLSLECSGEHKTGQYLSQGRVLVAGDTSALGAHKRKKWGNQMECYRSSQSSRSSQPLQWRSSPLPPHRGLQWQQTSDPVVHLCNGCGKPPPSHGPCIILSGQTTVLNSFYVMASQNVALIPSL